MKGVKKTSFWCPPHHQPMSIPSFSSIAISCSVFFADSLFLDFMAFLLTMLSLCNSQNILFSCSPHPLSDAALLTSHPLCSLWTSHYIPAAFIHTHTHTNTHAHTRTHSLNLWPCSFPPAVICKTTELTYPQSIATPHPSLSQSFHHIYFIRLVCLFVLDA